MARVTGIGELDWAMLGRADDNSHAFKELHPIFLINNTDNKHDVYRCVLYLVPDRQVSLHPDTFEDIDMSSKNPVVHVIQCKTGLVNHMLMPVFINESLMRLLCRCNQNLDNFSFSIVKMISSGISIMLSFQASQLIEHPDRYLHFLARKLSKWAKEVR